MDPADVLVMDNRFLDESYDETLISIIQSSGDTEALKLLNSGQIFSQDEMDTALISACRCGYESLVCALVRLGANVQTKDENGNTPLLICAENDFTNIAKLLIREKVNINTANNLGETALMLAIHPTGSLRMMKLLLAQTGINVNCQNKEGYTALMKAIKVLNIDFIKRLLDSQGNTAEVLHGIKNCTNETAQEMADKLGIGKVVKLLSKPHVTKVSNPILAAVLACDVDSFNILMNCRFYQLSNIKYIIEDCFKEVFVAHEKSGKNFSEDEEKIIQKLLECGDVHECSYSPNLALIAARVGSYKVLQMLLKHDVRPEFSDWSQTDLLAISAEHGHTQIVKPLREHTPKLARQEFTTPALKSALKNRHTNRVKLLNKRGANFDIKHSFTSAVNDNDSILLKDLVESFRVRIKHIISAKEMSNFVVSAAREGHIDIIGVLLDAGANVNYVNSENKTPLMESKNADVVNFLVQRGAVVNNQFYLPLAHVLSYCCSADKEKIIEALLKHHAPVNGRSRGGRTPLMVAVANRASRSILQILLDHGADGSLMDNRGSTVLHIAAEINSTEYTELLLQQTDVVNIINVQNREGLTALMIFTLSCNHIAMKVLIDHGADVNIKDFHGNTVLLRVLYKHIQKPEILTTLIQAGCDLNWQNTSGYTPLMLAAKTSLKDALMLLVDSGANVNVVSEKLENETALTLLLKYCVPLMTPCVEYLLHHGADASYLKPDVLLRLILHKKMQFIPRLIQCGLGPAEHATFKNPSYYTSVSVNKTVSPLWMALMTGNVKLARYFVGNLFVTKSDVFTLSHSQDLRHNLVRNNHPKCVEFLQQQSAQPMSLLSLASLAVQSAVGTAPGREERVSVLPLPQVVKNKLLFQVESVPWDMPDDDTLTFVGGLIPFDDLLLLFLENLL